MPKKINISQEELEAFYKAVEGTKPLQQNKVKLNHPTKEQNKIKQFKPLDEAFNLHDSEIHSSVQSEEFISHKHASVSHKILRKLRKGQYNIDAVLDMHGMTVDQARIAVDHFLQESLHEGLRMVLIIHGKGHHSAAPVLKNKLYHWLRELNVVLAFCSAAPQHGSRGAMYILLKRCNEENSIEE